MQKILKHFDVLTENGLKVIPLRKHSKVPVCRGWTDGWNKEQAREVLERLPDSNIGLLLGDVIDVEGDSVEANDKINDLIGEYPHPMYSSTKSIHHLFESPDPHLTILKHNSIEFRGHKHQSVLPPSTLDTGVEYKWLGPVRFPVPPMPERLLSFYRHLQSQREVLKPGHMKLPCFLCRKECFIHQKRFALELIAFKELGQRWQCHDCRKVDLRPACREIRKRKKGASQGT